MTLLFLYIFQLVIFTSQGKSPLQYLKVLVSHGNRAWGEIPLGYSTPHNKKPLFRMPYSSIPLVSEM